MAAGGGAGGGFHVAHQGGHFFWVQAAAGADGAVAGEAGEGGIQPGFERDGRVGFGEFIGEVAQQCGRVRAFQGGGDGADQDGAGAEGFDLEAEPVQGFGVGEQAGCVRWREVDDGGEQQGLGGDGAGKEFCAQAFLGEAFMGGVLVDDDERAIRGDGEDIGVENLGDGGAERVG